MGEERADGHRQQHYWAPLDLDNGYPELARYVSVNTLNAFGLSLERSDGDARTVDRSHIQGLFELLQKQGFRFRQDDWVPRGHGSQRIRHLGWIASEGGNCADLSTAFAAMCLRGKIAPLIAVTDRHAFVLARAGWLEAHRDDAQDFAVAGGRRVDDGVVRLEAADGLLQLIGAGELIPVDCVAATDPQVPFEQASDRCRTYIAPGLHLVDVTYLHDHGGFPPEDPPDAWPTVNRYPPEPAADVVLFAGQQRLADDLRSRGGQIVAIVAEPGKGKSTVARHLVDHAPNGAGWFLNASDPQALVDGMAEAQLNESGLPRPELERPDREGYALAALRRLRTASAPWIVALDNADGDPRQLLRYLPRPGSGQLVIITSTNGDWRRPGVEALELERVTDTEIEATLESSDLSTMIDGRALLLYAFQRLSSSESLTAAEIASFAPRDEPMPPEQEGPTAVWRALNGRPWFSERHRRLCAMAALLPPDYLPAELLERLSGAGAGTLATLAARGLFALDPQSGHARLHRLFGDSIRWNLEAGDHRPDDGPGALKDTALTLASSVEVRRLLSERADLTAVKRLLGLIDGMLNRGVSDPRSRDALRNLGIVLELRGDTAGSGRAYEMLKPMLADAEPDDLRILAEYHHAQARIANRNHAGDEAWLRPGLAHAEAAHRVATDLHDEDNLGRYLAMRGLLLKQLAAFPQPGESSAGLSEAALGVLEEAHSIRTDRMEQLGLLKTEYPEWARSYFNLAGARLPLAQSQPERAAEHLDRAHEIYAEVRELRQTIYNCEIHSHIAPCIQGLGLVAYYRALLVAADRAERSEQLREATHRLAEALAQWEELEGPEDGTEAAKASGYLFKVALARNAHPALAYKPHAERDGARKLSGRVAPLVTEVIQELGMRHEVR